VPALGEQYEMAGLSVFFTERSTMNAWLLCVRACACMRVRVCAWVLIAI
jgi:hypothetical protein